MNSIILFALSLILMSCQSRPELNCSQLDWRELGQKKALDGVKKEKGLKQIQTQCLNKDYLFDESAFDSGYKDGLNIYCRVDKGFAEGEKGADYNNICPKNLEKDFVKGYVKGRIEYLRERIKQNTALYSEAQDRYWRKEQEYSLIMNEDPQQAKLQRDFLEAYKEETKKLKELIQANKKELSYYKKKNQDIKFN